MSWEAAIDYADAKEMKLVLKQGAHSAGKASATSSRANTARGSKATARSAEPGPPWFRMK
jgi:hypothetical protein